MRTIWLGLVFLVGCEADKPVDDELVEVEITPAQQPTEGWFHTEGAVDLAQLKPVPNPLLPGDPVLELACEHPDHVYRERVYTPQGMSGMVGCDGLAWCRWGAARLPLARPAERDQLAMALTSCQGLSGTQTFANPGFSARVWLERGLETEGALPEEGVQTLLQEIEAFPQTDLVFRLSTVPNNDSIAERVLAIHDGFSPGSVQQQRVALALGWYDGEPAWSRYMRTCASSDEHWCQRATTDRLLPGLTLKDRVLDPELHHADATHRFVHEFPEKREELIEALKACSSSAIRSQDGPDPSVRDRVVMDCSLTLATLDTGATQRHARSMKPGTPTHRSLVASQAAYVGPQAQIDDLRSRGVLGDDSQPLATVRRVADVMVHNERAVRWIYDDHRVPHPQHVPTLRRMASLAGLHGVRFVETQQLHLAVGDRVPLRLEIHDGTTYFEVTLAPHHTPDMLGAVAVINALLSRRHDERRLLLTVGDEVLLGTSDQLNKLVRQGLVHPAALPSPNWRLERRWRPAE